MVLLSLSPHARESGCGLLILMDYWNRRDPNKNAINLIRNIYQKKFFRALSDLNVGLVNSVEKVSRF